MSKRLVIALPPPEYERLVERARQEDRLPEQQAVHLLKCWLRDDADVAPNREAADVSA